MMTRTRKHGYGMGGSPKDIASEPKPFPLHDPKQPVTYPGMRDFDVSDTLISDVNGHMPDHEGSARARTSYFNNLHDLAEPERLERERVPQQADEWAEQYAEDDDGLTTIHLGQHQPWVAVDLDGTILTPPPSSHPARGSQTDQIPFGEPLQGAKEALSELAALGWRISIYTARFGDPALSDEVVETWANEIAAHLHEHEIPFSDIWVGRKPRADFFIDDKAIMFEGDWDSILHQLAQPKTAAALTPADIVKILKVIDTREYEEGPDGKWHAIPGSGAVSQCARCGRDHEVHAEVELRGGQTAVVGTGCMKGSSLEPAAKSLTVDAKKYKLLIAERAKLSEQLAANKRIREEVARLPAPEIKLVQATPDRTMLVADDAERWLFETEMSGRHLEKARQDVEGIWRRLREKERGLQSGVHAAQLDEIDRKLKRLSDKATKAGIQLTASAALPVMGAVGHQCPGCGEEIHEKRPGRWDAERRGFVHHCGSFYRIGGDENGFNGLMRDLGSQWLHLPIDEDLGSSVTSIGGEHE